MNQIVELDQKFKEDHVNRPIIIIKIRDESKEFNKYEIILERFHSRAKEAEDFLIQVAEPSSITNNIQTFQITFYSLYTAMALQLTEESIIKRLDELAKNEKLPVDIISFICVHTKYFNKASFYLQDGQYYIDIEVNLNKELWKKSDMFLGKTLEYVSTERFNSHVEDEMDIEHLQGNHEVQERNKYKILNNAHFLVNQLLVEKFNVPVNSSYDFHAHAVDVPQKLKGQFKHRPIVKLFEHQKRALSKIFKDDIARSGVVILPCGSGKTLLGISVVIKIKQRTLVICDSVNSVIQWHEYQLRFISQFLLYTFVDKSQIVMIMSGKETDLKTMEKPNIIVIITQDMLQSERPDIKLLRDLTWNCCIMDEVHGLPAKQVSKAFGELKTHMKIGLTATPFRQDNKIREIFYKIGPKLHESMIVDLTTLGFVSKIYCIQIQVDMEKKYREKFQKEAARNNQQVMNTLYQLNPRKYEVLQHLIDLHRSRKDKILIFCEKINKLSNTGTLQKFAQINKCPIILQDVEQRERQAVYKMFREDKLDVIIFGQIADQGLDLPSANVGIQISFNFNSVRQEFQRMGRIQRKKENVLGTYDCFFYTLVSKGTREVQIQFERQISVINQGYPYEVLSESDLNMDREALRKIKDVLNEMEQKILDFTPNQLNQDDDD